MNRVVLACLVYLLCASVMKSVYAQTSGSYEIKGVAIDSTTMKPIGFATVILNDTTAAVRAVAADANGKFSITHNKAGRYKIQVTFVGYATREVEVELSQLKKIDLGTVAMSAGVEIAGVSVVGQLISSDIDKVSYNAVLDPEAASLTALEIMRKVPMLTVDGEDNLKLNGQGNYKILVNGKTNTLMSNNYKDVLRSMPASSIKAVEVITNPPAKYDAEGVDGIINIVTERKSIGGYNGSLSLRGDHFGGYGGSGYIAATLGKFSLSTNVGTGVYRQPDTYSITERVNELSTDGRYVNQRTEGSGQSRHNNISLDMSYEIDTFNLVSLSFWGYLGNYERDGIVKAEYLDVDHVKKQWYDNITESSGNYGGMAGNIDWQRTFMKPDKTLTMSYRADIDPGGNSYSSNLKGYGGYADRHQRSENDNLGAEHTFQIDYYNPINKKHTIETGAKFLLRPNTSESINETFENGAWVEDIARKNDLDYMQYITSGYGSYQFRLKKFSVKGGLRAEFTINTGTFKLAEDHDLFNRFFNVVPYVTTQYKINDAKNIKLGYTQRLQRPGIWYLNPYVNDADPTSIRTGNPELDSEIRHTFDLSYNSFGKKSNFGSSFRANFSNNAIENVTRIIENNVLFSTYENCGRRQNYSLNVFGGARFFEDKLTFNLNGGVNYTKISSIYNSELNNEGFSYNGNMSIYAKTWKNANVNAFIGCWSSSVGLQSSSSTQVFYSFSMSQSFLKDRKLRFNLGVSNPFEKTRKYRSESFGVGYRSVSESFYPSRRINFGCQWNFGKMNTQVKKAKRGINNDDKMSGGSEGGSGGGGGQ